MGRQGKSLPRFKLAWLFVVSKSSRLEVKDLVMQPFFKVAGFAAIIAILWFIWMVLDPRNQFSATSTFGISFPELFGSLRVGMVEDEVDTRLFEAGLEKGELRNPGDGCLTTTVPTDSIAFVYHDNSWRRGGVCVVFRDGVATDIRYLYNPFMP
jgi:hypothetical protein